MCVPLQLGHPAITLATTNKNRAGPEQKAASSGTAYHAAYERILPERTLLN